MNTQTRPHGGSLLAATTAVAPLVVPFEELERGDLALAGGKGANLGELIRAGFPVPAGFVVTTVSYDRFVAHNHLDGVIDRALQEGQGDDALIRAAFEGAPIPPEVERAVLAAHAQLGPGPVAVRSSATTEDLPEAAFAGQHDTYLNVAGESAVLGAVRRCWGSPWTGRAIAYRGRQGASTGPSAATRKAQSRTRQVPPR